MYQTKFSPRLLLFRIAVIFLAALIVVGAGAYCIGIAVMALQQQDLRFGMFLFIPVLIAYMACLFIKSVWK